MDILFPFLKNLENAAGSEHGWAINAVKLFLELGHDVYFTDDVESYTTTGKIADVVYLPYRMDQSSGELDQERWRAYKDVKKILFGVYNPREPCFLKDVPENGILVTPYRDCNTNCYVLPYTYYHTRPTPNYTKATLGWTVRNPFYFVPGPTNLGPEYTIHLQHLKVCHRLVKDGYKLVLFSDNTYPKGVDRPGLPNFITEAYDILDDLRDSPNVIVTDNLPYTDYIALLQETSVIVPLNAVGNAPEALKVGSVPLSWISVVNIYSNSFKGQAYHSLTYDVIYEKVLRLLTEEDFYRSEYDRLLECSPVYSIEQALDMARKILEV